MQLSYRVQGITPSDECFCVNGSVESRQRLVSVIVPVFNRSSLLSRAIQSAVDQSHPELEIIVVDDGSTEDIDGVLREFDDERIVCLRHDTNRGVAAARNTGLRHAHGHYIGFLDSDDEWFKNKVERQVANLEGTEKRCKVSYHPLEVFDDTSSKVIELTTFTEEGMILGRMLQACYVGLIQIMMRREEFLRVGQFNEGFFSHDDWDMLIRLSERCQFSYIDEVLARYHHHDGIDGMISARYEKYARDRTLLYELHRTLYEERRETHAHYLSDLAAFVAITGDRRGARRLLLRSVALNPLRLDPYVKMLLTLVGRRGVR